MPIPSVVKGGAVGAQVDVAASQVDEGGLALDDRSQDDERCDSPGTSDSSSLTLYLKELRAVPLLPHAREIELAKKREEGESRALDHILSCRPALPYVLHLGELVERGELAIVKVIDSGDDPAENSENAADDERIRNEFLRDLSRLRRMAAELKALERKIAKVSTCERAELHVQVSVIQAEICRLLRGLRLCRRRLAEIAARPPARAGSRRVRPGTTRFDGGTQPTIDPTDQAGNRAAAPLRHRDG